MKTKFIAPVARSKTIARRRLLDPGGARRFPTLTLVAAPAGFGKTTLLIQLRDTLLANGHTAPWLTLGTDDHSPTELLRDIIEAIQYEVPSFGSRTGRIVGGNSRLDITRTLNDFVEDVNDTETPVVLFLDDYHLVSNSETDELIELLLNLAPDNFQMAVASRTRPQFGLAALRVRDELHEITSAQLRFNLSEAAEFLTEVRKLGLSNQQVEKIHDTAELYQCDEYADDKYVDH